MHAVEMPDLCTVPLVCTMAESVPDHVFHGSTFAIEIKVTGELILFIVTTYWL